MLTLLAIVKAKPEFKDDVKNECLKLIEPTRKEDGCIVYDMHTDNNDENKFVFYESWQTYESWQEHMKTNHIENFKKATEDKTQEWQLFELSKVEK